MTRQRLSREQSREQTKERLLDAAHAVFMQKGFPLTSVEDISAAAGYSRGAFYSNFDDKTQLFFELLRREGESIDQEFHRMLGGPVDDLVALQEEVATHYSQLYQGDKCSLLWMEARIVALRDEKFRVELNGFLEERYRQIAEFVEMFARLTGTKPAAPPREIAIGLMALCEGVSFSHRCAPDMVDGKTAESVLSWFLKASIAAPAPAAQPPQKKAPARKPAAKRKKAG
ncbi:TetR/AcrR family transcriptional regulator [Herbaspirillum chlorophenolicum]|uniref:TetR/AcrR family transcriptional regulator n=1 Tax=Herbaspirillum chlorophenolicum TaxID=211589 RepID=UPI00067D417C|nr:TetR/AcrR family transcriptional regulator [Herbaspirillum chlorophenolicum]